MMVPINRAMMEAPSSAPGISFLCQSVVANEDSFGIFAVDGITEPHPFHVVYTSNINAKHYDYQESIYYMDIVAEAESLGDYIVNVVDAVKQQSHHKLKV